MSRGVLIKFHCNQFFAFAPLYHCLKWLQYIPVSLQSQRLNIMTKPVTCYNYFMESMR